MHDKEQSINVTEENLKDFVGKPVFSRLDHFWSKLLVVYAYNALPTIAINF